MLSSNCSRCGVVWCEWSLAWSIVAPEVAFAEACLRRLATRAEAGEPALEKTVTMSRVLCYGGSMSAGSSMKLPQAGDLRIGTSWANWERVQAWLREVAGFNGMRLVAMSSREVVFFGYSRVGTSWVPTKIWSHMAGYFSTQYISFFTTTLDL